MPKLQAPRDRPLPLTLLSRGRGSRAIRDDPHLPGTDIGLCSVRSPTRSLDVIRSLVTALLLLTLPLAQARAVVVCAMNDVPQATESSDCVCPHAKQGRHAPDRTDAAHADCCTVEFAPAGTTQAAMNAVSDEGSRASVPKHEPTLLAPPPSPVDVVAVSGHAHRSPPSFAPIPPDGADLYLTTGRLRL